MNRPFLCIVRILSVLVVCHLWSGWTCPAYAGSDIERSVESYKRGYSLYFEKKYTLALQYFLLSYRSLPQVKRYRNTRNVLNFFIGDCYNHLGQKRDTYVYFKAYVDALRKSPKRHTSKKYQKALRITKKLEKAFGLKSQGRSIARQTQQKLQKSISKPKRTQPRAIRIVPKPRSPHIGAWLVTGVGVATLAGGLLAGILAHTSLQQAQAAHSTLRNQPQPPARQVTQPAQRALAQSTAANTLYIAGGSLTGVGIVLLFTWRETR